MYRFAIESLSGKHQEWSKKGNSGPERERSVLPGRLQEIGQRLSEEEIADHSVILFPEGKRGANGGARARVATAGKAGNRSERAFHPLQDLTDRILVRLTGEPVSAASAAGSQDQFPGHKILGEDLKVLF